MQEIKSYTDISQSKKLAKILRLESVDMFYRAGNETQPIVRLHSYGHIMLNNDVPCWSLTALVDVLPQSIEFKGDKYYLRFMKEYVEYANNEISITGRCLHTTGGNLIDACYNMILKLHELKIL